MAITIKGITDKDLRDLDNVDYTTNLKKIMKTYTRERASELMKKAKLLRGKIKIGKGFDINEGQELANYIHTSPLRKKYPHIYMGRTGLGDFEVVIWSKVKLPDF